jgi:hypothetical protein
VIGLKVEHGGDNKVKHKRKESMEGDKKKKRNKSHNKGDRTGNSD